MPADDVSGDIVTIDSHVFFFPNNETLPYLEWKAESQCFDLVERDDVNAASCFSSKENGSDNVLRDGLWVSCRALYGVLPLGGSTSILLYIVHDKHVATLPFSVAHDVFAVKRFAWMRLPSRPVSPASSDAKESIDGEKHYFSESLSEDIVKKYCALIDRFCSRFEHHSGGSRFFYSPTVNLALDPSDLAESSGTRYSTLSTSGSYLDFKKKIDFSRADAIEENPSLAFQWNSPLLDAFKVLDASAAGISAYVPVFIRGLVAMSPTHANGVQLLLVNQLSCCWAGTRYNRRGLDSAGSGFTANFSISTLWVFAAEEAEEEQETAEKDTASKPFLTEEKRMAAYQILRGSIPRCWSQPANLNIFPKITISSPSCAVDELNSHLKVLGELLHGMSTLHCLDTTSSHKAELPLSEAFEKAVVDYNEPDAKRSISYQVHYSKFNVGEKWKKGLSYEEIKRGVNELVNGALNGEAKQKCFSQWCSKRKSLKKEDNFSTVDTDDMSIFRWKKIHQQEDYIRVNCLDCLDRTNLVQSMIVTDILPDMIRYVRGSEDTMNNGTTNTTGNNNSNNHHNYENNTDMEGETPTDEDTFAESIQLSRELWAEQGMVLSELYAGSEPHFLAFQKKGTRGPFETKKALSIALRRWLQQNFYDGDKQDIISVLTRQHDPGLIHIKSKDLFSRPFSTLNIMVVLGLFFAVVPFFVNLATIVCMPWYGLSVGPFVYLLCWSLYIMCMAHFIMKEGVSYTNYPLLR